MISNLKIKQQVFRAVRAWFEARDFLEMMVPCLNRSVPLEPTIYPFATTWTPRAKTQTFYLSISPERSMKKYLARGVGNCFGIGHCFRNLEDSGETHHPEFLMLEWYRENGDYTQIMEDTKKLCLAVWQKVCGRKDETVLTYQNKKYDLSHWEVKSLEKLIEEKLQVKMSDLVQDDFLFNFARARGYDTHEATFEQVFNQIILNEIEVDFSRQPFFLIDFPARLSPLCRVNKDKPYLAERFEAYIAGIELGNGNNENIDEKLVQKSFESEYDERQKLRVKSLQPVDMDFVNNLKTIRKSGKTWAGMGLGVDRLLMLMADTKEISEIGFSF